MRENPFIDWLKQQHFAVPPASLLGIGDDAAILAGSNCDLVVSTDLICDGVHFTSSKCRPEQVGRKALAVNLSDMAAMAAKPTAAFVSLLMPRDATESYAQQVMMGVSQLAEEFGVAIAGGDTNTWDGLLVVNVAVVGEVTPAGPLLRNGAEPGDVLLVTGSLGGSIHGRHLDFTPRVREALLLNERYELHAGLDLSDGLAMDLRRLTQASGCGAEIFAQQIPISTAARRQSSTRSEALDHALGDGEDFELLLAVPPSEAEHILGAQPLDVPVTAIGRCIDGSDVWLVDDNERRPLPMLGYEHGSTRQ